MSNLNNKQIQNFQCPECGLKGCSVASINNKEKHYSEKISSHSGSGLGLSSGGLAVGVYTGSGHEEVYYATQRGLLFEAPLKPSLMQNNFVLSARTRFLIMLSALFLMLKFATLDETQFQHLSNIYFVIPFIFLFGSISFILDLSMAPSEEVSKEHQQRMAKYEECLKLYKSMKYCDDCNLVYDNERQRIEWADSKGYQAMF